MKKYLFLLTWFCYASTDPTGNEIAKFLSKLPPKSAQEAKVVVSTSMNRPTFFVFYEAEKEVKR